MNINPTKTEARRALAVGNPYSNLKPDIALSASALSDASAQLFHPVVDLSEQLCEKRSNKEGRR